MGAFLASELSLSIPKGDDESLSFWGTPPFGPQRLLSLPEAPEKCHHPWRLTPSLCKLMPQEDRGEGVWDKVWVPEVGCYEAWVGEVGMGRAQLI